MSAIHLQHAAYLFISSVRLSSGFLGMVILITMESPVSSCLKVAPLLFEIHIYESFLKSIEIQFVAYVHYLIFFPFQSSPSFSIYSSTSFSICLTLKLFFIVFSTTALLILSSSILSRALACLSVSLCSVKSFCMSSGRLSILILLDIVD